MLKNFIIQYDTVAEGVDESTSPLDVVTGGGGGIEIDPGLTQSIIDNL